MSILIGLVIGIGLFYIWMQYETHQLEYSFYQIESEKITHQFDGAKFIIISDLHNNQFGKKNEILLSAIEKQKPDFIVIAGDMIVGEKKWNMNIALPFLEALSKQYDVFYANGNHEQKLGSYEETKDSSYRYYCEKIREFGIHHLINESVYLYRGAEKIRISGLELPLCFFGKIKRPSMTDAIIEQCIRKKKEEIFELLIAHNPMYFPYYANWGADLVISGHVHGGMIRFPYLGGAVSPQIKLFPKYDAGFFRQNQSFLIVSRGLGTHTIKVRIANRPELAVVTLKQKNRR